MLLYNKCNLCKERRNLFFFNIVFKCEKSSRTILNARLICTPEVLSFIKFRYFLVSFTVLNYKYNHKLRKKYIKNEEKTLISSVLDVKIQYK